MTSRRVRVKIEGVYSEWVTLDTGIGEGSILGPLIFLIVMSGMTAVLKRTKTRIRLEAEANNVTDKSGKVITDDDVVVTSEEYADDVQGILIHEQDEILQWCGDIMMDEMCQFFSCVNMSVNRTKTEVCCIRGGDHTHNIVIAGQSEAEELRILGLFFRKDWSFAGHIARLKSAEIGRAHV